MTEIYKKLKELEINKVIDKKIQEILFNLTKEKFDIEIAKGFRMNCFPNTIIFYTNCVGITFEISIYKIIRDYCIANKVLETKNNMIMGDCLTEKAEMNLSEIFHSSYEQKIEFSFEFKNFEEEKEIVKWNEASWDNLEI